MFVNGRVAVDKAVGEPQVAVAADGLADIADELFSGGVPRNGGKRLAYPVARERRRRQELIQVPLYDFCISFLRYRIKACEETAASRHLGATYIGMGDTGLELTQKSPTDSHVSEHRVVKSGADTELADEIHLEQMTAAFRQAVMTMLRAVQPVTNPEKAVR